MKYLLIIVIAACIFSACGSPVDSITLQKKIDSLEQKLSSTYKPGFGEFMSNIQVHHAKLWFAGQNDNWPLADFEIHEIMESLEDIKVYQSERKEAKFIGMLDPALDSINNAISKKDPALFKSSFIFLTNTCNNCHKEVEFSFNVVRIPGDPPFSNQDFTVHK